MTRAFPIHQILFAGGSVDDAKAYITSMGLTKDDVKLVVRDEMVIVETIREGVGL